jgi:nitrogen regulatory protein PII
MESSQAIFIVLSDPGRTERALKLLLDCEIRGATVIESMGMGHVLEDSIPVIASIRSLLSQQRESNQTIFAVSKYPEKIEKAVKMISEEFDGFKEPCTGLIFVVPVVTAVGLGRKDSFL